MSEAIVIAGVGMRTAADRLVREVFEGRRPPE